MPAAGNSGVLLGTVMPDDPIAPEPAPPAPPTSPPPGIPVRPRQPADDERGDVPPHDIT
jgi:hypothetical protein